MDYDRDLETKEQEDQEENGEELEWDGSEAELVADDDAAVY